MIARALRGETRRAECVPSPPQLIQELFGGDEPHVLAGKGPQEHLAIALRHEPRICQDEHPRIIGSANEPSRRLTHLQYRLGEHEVAPRCIIPRRSLAGERIGGLDEGELRDDDPLSVLPGASKPSQKLLRANRRASRRSGNHPVGSSPKHPSADRPAAAHPPSGAETPLRSRLPSPSCS